MTLPGLPTAIANRDRRSSSVSSTRSYRSVTMNAAKRHVTPSILQSIYPITEEETKVDIPGAPNAKNSESKILLLLLLCLCIRIVLIPVCPA